MQDIIKETFFTTHGHLLPAYMWLIVVFVLLLLLIWSFKFFPKSSFVVFFEMVFEWAYEFFEEILGLEEKRWLKVYVTLMFFIILISNFLWVFLEFLLPVFGHHMEEIIKIPTADINFNVAMAVVWVFIVILEQFKFLWFWKTIYEYVPVWWKDLIPFERWNLPKPVDNLVFVLVKAIDIFISIFLWLLEIVWHAAKVISLSFRLFWNMISGGILLWMLFAAIIWVTSFMAWITWVEGDGFPIIGPLILYAQEILVALIQALVFPLLIAIFVKVAKVH